MDFSNITLFNLMRAKLNYMSARQSVLAQNIANADTPNYRAKDVETPDFQKLAQSMSPSSAQNLPMMMTSKAHMPSSIAVDPFTIERRKKTDELNPTGNNVVIEEEMMKVAENQAEYQKVLNLYAKTIAMFKTAIGRPTGG